MGAKEGAGFILGGVLGAGAIGVVALGAHLAGPPTPYPFANAPHGSSEARFNTLAGRIQRFVPDSGKLPLNDPSVYTDAYHKLATTVDRGELASDPKFLAMAIGIGMNLESDIRARDASHPEIHEALTPYRANVERDTSMLKQKLDKLTAQSLANPNPAKLPGPTHVPVGVTR